MFGTRWRLFHLFGIPLFLDISWVLILVLLTGNMTGLFVRELPDLPKSLSLVLGLVTAVAFFACIVLHELGHALVARATGLKIRGITLFLFGGVAELEEEPRSAGGEFVMAVAGPLVSAALAGAFFLLAFVGDRAGWHLAAVKVFSYLGAINLAVLVFNMVPAFPLDGGRVLRSFLWGVTGSLRRSTWYASLLGRGFAWLLIAFGVYLVLQAEYLQGIWLAIIGLFLNNAARGSYQAVLLRQTLQGEPVRRFMNAEPIAVAPETDLRTWVEDYVYRYHRKSFPVVAGGKLEGCVTTRGLARFPRGEWDRHTVGEVMDCDLAAVSIRPDADALEALGRMRQTGYSRLLVVEGDRLVGIVSLKDLLRFLNLKLELEAEERDGAPPAKDPAREETAARP
jgi:Zn-dependent protease/CBS domain-containing protein